MTNQYYTASGSPPAQTRGTSAALRSEFLAIQAGFSALPASAYAVDAGTANAYVVAVNTAITSYTDGLQIIFKASNANTGASTINVNGIGATSIVHVDGSVLQAGDIYANQFAAVIYNASTGKFVFSGAALGQVFAAISSMIAATQFQTALPGTAGQPLGSVPAITAPGVAGWSQLSTDMPLMALGII